MVRGHLAYTRPGFFFLVAFLCIAAFPVSAHASSLVWGTTDGSGPAQVEMTDGGTYTVPLNVPAPVYFVPSPTDNFFLSFGMLYQVSNDPGAPRTFVNWVYLHDFSGDDQTFTWPAAGSYELDITVVAPPQVNFKDRILRALASIFFADVAHAQFGESTVVETVHFTIQDLSTSCASDCFSNVLFLPGMEASRLYTKVNEIEHQVWEPGITSRQSDARLLYMNADGTSINNIYTKENAAIDQYGVPLYMSDVYRTFLLQLAGLKTSGTVNDVGVFPYDWRMSPIDVVENGTMYDDGIHFPANLVATLAATSKTSKVTIVAHSNGGLVAKALLQKLERDDSASLVDKVIFVDVPQTGTPKAVASMLHGDFQNIPGFAGFIVSKATARGLGENMPDAFDLLPSAAYFATVATPVIDLSNAPGLRSTSGISGTTITSSADLSNFMTGTGGRQKPAANDIETPNVLAASLVNDAAALHQSLDTWTPPAGVQAIQIAGWGLDTPSGITYTEKRTVFCIALSCAFATTTQHVVQMTEDGDKTVVIPSQVTNTIWPTYYINLQAYNKDKGLLTDHSNITETQPFQALFPSLLTSSTQGLPKYITTSQPAAVVTEKSLRLRVLSPVSLDAYDSAGRHTGVAPNPNSASDLQYIEEQIPNSYYEEFGEGKYIGLPGDGNYQIRLKGLDTGTFTFEVTPVSGGVSGPTVSYADIPVTTSTTASIDLSSSAPASSPLKLDTNGDGITDTTLASGAQSADPLTYARLIKTSVAGMDIGKAIQKQLKAKINNVIYLVMRQNNWDSDDDDGKDTNKTDKITQQISRKLDRIEAYIQREVGKPIKRRPKDESISQGQASAIINMIEHLKALIIGK